MENKPLYTWSDIILDPEDPRLRDLINPKVFVSCYPAEVLHNALNDKEYVVLTAVNKESLVPFEVSNGTNWQCLIVRKNFLALDSEQNTIQPGSNLVVIRSSTEEPFYDSLVGKCFVAKSMSDRNHVICCRGTEVYEIPPSRLLKLC